jgi:hypothetical protein
MSPGQGLRLHVLIAGDVRTELPGRIAGAASEDDRRMRRALEYDGQVNREARVSGARDKIAESGRDHRCDNLYAARRLSPDRIRRIADDGLIADIQNLIVRHCRVGGHVIPVCGSEFTQREQDGTRFGPGRGHKGVCPRPLPRCVLPSVLLREHNVYPVIGCIKRLRGEAAGA